MRFQFNKEKLISAGKGFLMAAIGAGLTYLLETAATLDFGSYSEAVGAFIGAFANFIRLWMKA